jgi:hypothetical protein
MMLTKARAAVENAELERLQQLVEIANGVTLAQFGASDSCILTSFPLAHCLRELGYADARPVRVEAAIHPVDRKLVGSILGAQNPRLLL